MEKTGVELNKCNIRLKMLEVLRYLNPAQETALQCNTLNTGLGPTHLENGQPISIHIPESNYTQIEKVFGAEKFSQKMWLAKGTTNHWRLSTKSLLSQFLSIFKQCFFTYRKEIFACK